MTRVAFLYFPAGTSSQLPPTMLQSIIKRRAKRMLLSYVRKLFEPRPSIVMPLSRMPEMQKTHASCGKPIKCDDAASHSLLENHKRFKQSKDHK
jgi:hypothetical protein